MKAVGSSDANHVYEDHSHCYACQKQVWWKDDNSMAPQRQNFYNNDDTLGTVGSKLTDISSYPSYPMASRKISRDIVDYFNVRMSVDEDGKPEATLLLVHKRRKDSRL